MTNQFNPNWASCPGETVLDIMNEKLINEFTLSKMLSLSLSQIDELLDGRLIINEDLAYGLSIHLGSTKQFWLNRENHYRERLLLSQ